MKRFLVLAALICLTIASGVSAQVTAVTTIPFESKANPIVLSPDDHTLATYHNYIIYMTSPTVELTPIWLLDTRTGEMLGSLSGFTDWVTDAAFNADGSRLASMHRNGDISLWDVAEQKLLKTIQTYALGGGWIEFVGDTNSVVYRAGEFVMGLLDTETGAITRLFGRHLDSMDEFQERYVQFPGRGDLMNSAAVTSPDSHWLANTTGNDEIIVRDIETGDERTLRLPSEEPAQFNIRAMVFSPDSSALTYYDLGDDQFHVLDVLTGEEIRTYAHGWSQFALAPDGVTVAYADRETRAIYLADTTSTDEPAKLLDLPENLDVGPNITVLAFTSDGKQLVVGGLFAHDGKNQIYVFNLAD